MPWESEKQRRYMHAVHPKIADKMEKDIKEHKARHKHGGHSHADGPAEGHKPKKTGSK